MDVVPKVNPLGSVLFFSVCGSCPNLNPALRGGLLVSVSIVFVCCPNLNPLLAAEVLSGFAASDLFFSVNVVCPNLKPPGDAGFAPD